MSSMNPAHAMHLSNLASRYQTTESDGPNVMSLASLLIKADLMSSDDLKDAVEIAKSLKTSVDQILRQSGYVNDLQFENVVKARAYLTSNLAVEGLIVTALKMAFKKQIPLEQALKLLGYGW